MPKEGVFEVSTASGRVDLADIVTEGPSDFRSASGNISVKLQESLAYDVSLSTASSAAVLSYQGNPVEGHFEFIARVGRGKIISPYPFDEEATFTEGGVEYHRKTVIRGKNTPRVVIRISSGKAELKR
jgi:hypothetical protein